MCIYIHMQTSHIQTHTHMLNDELKLVPDIVKTCSR